MWKHDDVVSNRRHNYLMRLRLRYFTEYWRYINLITDYLSVKSANIGLSDSVKPSNYIASTEHVSHLATDITITRDLILLSAHADR